ncbi:RNA polymerase sigma factor [Candidatus Eisenbacteria bacterium]|uniref:RNA polymerase sigma factor n=1 Tax=Eiseniibacteriota bacterium TaxID=2212470 RepID=A0ABV6YMV0_UNCEI
MGLTYEEVFEGWEIEMAVFLIRDAQARWPCLAREDSKDLLQECLFRWHSANDSHDPAKGATKRTYMDRVLRNKLADIRREMTADIRRVNFEAESLDDPVGDTGDTTKGELLDPATILGAPSDAVIVISLKATLSRVLPKLTSRQRELWELRLSGYSTSEASEMLGISRDTAHEDIKRMRILFEKAGLREYLK